VHQSRQLQQTDSHLYYVKKYYWQPVGKTYDGCSDFYTTSTLSIATTSSTKPLSSTRPSQLSRSIQPLSSEQSRGWGYCNPPHFCLLSWLSDPWSTYICWLRHDLRQNSRMQWQQGQYGSIGTTIYTSLALPLWVKSYLFLCIPHFLSVWQNKGTTPIPTAHASCPSLSDYRYFLSLPVEPAPKDHKEAKCSVYFPSIPGVCYSSSQRL